jgi:hypothetical protein
MLAILAVGWSDEPPSPEEPSYPVRTDMEHPVTYNVEGAVARLEKAWEEYDRDCRPEARIPPFKFTDGAPDRSCDDYISILYHHLRAWTGRRISRRSTNATELRLLWEVERFERDESRHLLSLLAQGPRVLDDDFFLKGAGASVVRAEDRGHVWYTLVDAVSADGEKFLAATMLPAGAELLQRAEEPEPDYVAWAKRNARIRRNERLSECLLMLVCAPVLGAYLAVAAAYRMARTILRKASQAR